MKEIFPKHLFVKPKLEEGKPLWEFSKDPLREKITKIDMAGSEALRKAMTSNFTDDFIKALYLKATSTPPENINIEIKGETRSGKSTVGIFLGMLISYYHGLEFTVDNILPNQSELLYKLKDAKYGETFLVDEQTPEVFGEGLYRESSQLGSNLNISAKRCNNLIFIYPPHFSSRNAPFGLEAVSKDYKNRYVKAYYHDLRTKSFGYGGVYPRGFVLIPKYQDGEYKDRPRSKWSKSRLDHFAEAGYDFDSELEEVYEEKKDNWISEIRNMDASVRSKKKEEFARELAGDDRFVNLRKNAMREAYIQLKINKGEFIELTKGEIESLANMAMTIYETGE